MDPELVLNQLWKFTPLQTSFGIIMLALNGGRPEVMPLKDILAAFVAFREEVVRRRTVFELKESRKRAHTLAGLAVAVVNIDEVVALIRNSPDPTAAKERLLARDWPVGDMGPFIELIGDPGRGVVDGTYKLSEEQAKAILDLRLQRLTGLERAKIAEELKEVTDRIRDYLAILASRGRIQEIVRTELAKAKEDFGDPRRTEISDAQLADTDIEDLILREEMVLTITQEGYVKRVPLSTYRAQRRGGKGRTGMTTKELDVVSQVYAVDTHTPVLFFSTHGHVYKLKVYKLPLGNPSSRGRALVNVLNLDPGETVSVVLPLPEEAKWSELDIVLATASGNVRRNALTDFVEVKQSGKIAMKLDAGDKLVGAAVCTAANDALLATRLGKCIRFEVGDVRVFQSRSSTGVRGIDLAEGDEVISLTMLRHVDFTADERDAYLRYARAKRGGEEPVENGDKPADPGEGEESAGGAIQLSPERLAEMEGAEEFVLGIARDGYGKRTSAYEYRITNRGGKGIDNMVLERGKGKAKSTVVAAFPAASTNQLLLVTKSGQILRTRVEEIRIAGRATRGVVVFRVDDSDAVVSVGRLAEGD
jgi:DNA gyrase subunit A